LEAKLKPNEPSVYRLSGPRRYLKSCARDTRILIRGEIPADYLIGTDEGSTRFFFPQAPPLTPARRPRPAADFADLIPHLPRQAQGPNPTTRAAP